MDLKQAMERIEQLERRVKELEAHPAQHIHYHTHPSPLPYIPPQYIPPQNPNNPWWQEPFYQPNWVVTCGSSIGGGSSN